MIGRAKIRTEAGVISQQGDFWGVADQIVESAFCVNLIRPSTSGWRVIQEEYPRGVDRRSRLIPNRPVPGNAARRRRNLIPSSGKHLFLAHALCLLCLTHPCLPALYFEDHSQWIARLCETCSLGPYSSVPATASSFCLDLRRAPKSGIRSWPCSATTRGVRRSSPQAIAAERPPAPQGGRFGVYELRNSWAGEAWAPSTAASAPTTN